MLTLCHNENMTTSTTPAIHRYRHEESENHCHRGVECLLLAEEENYQNRELLAEAADSFLAAIQHHRQNTEAYVGMAYLLWVLGDEARAYAYLEEGLRTQPSHPDVHRLIQTMSGQSVTEARRAGASERPLPSLPATGSGLAAPNASAGERSGLEQRIQRIQTRIAQTIQQVNAEDTRLIRPTINVHEIERLQEARTAWETLYYEILSEIDTLDTFHLRVMLTCELTPLQDRILDYQSVQECSAELLGLDDQIQAVHGDVRQTYGDFLAQKPGMYDALLESYYDRCDELADALDELERKNIPVRVLDSHYQQLVDRVEEFALALGESDA